MTSRQIYREFLYEEREPGIWSFWHVDYDGPEDPRCFFGFKPEGTIFDEIDHCIDILDLDIPMEQEPAQ